MDNNILCDRFLGTFRVRHNGSYDRLIIATNGGGSSCDVVVMMLMWQMANALLRKVDTDH